MAKRDQTKRAWWRIEHESFLVKIPNYFIPRNDYANRGEFTTGSNEIDTQMAQREELWWGKLYQLITIWEQSGSFSFVRPFEDIPIIHAILQEHINDYIAYLQSWERGLVSDDPEVMANRALDMQSIDQFARDIYRLAYKTDLPSTKHGYTGLTGLGDGGVFDSPFAPQKKAEAEEYTSLTEIIDFSALNQRRRW